MATIQATFYGKSTFSGVNMYGEPEWPPSPARLFQALVSVADDNARDALRVLETTPPPVIYASDETNTCKVEVASSPKHTSNFSSKSEIEVASASVIELPSGNLGKAGSLLVRRHGMTPDVATVMYVVPGLGAEDARALHKVARDIPYLGKSCDSVAVRVTEDDPDVPKGCYRWMPILGKGVMKSWSPGFLDALDKRYALDVKSGKGSINNPSHPDHVTQSVRYMRVVQGKRQDTDYVSVRFKNYCPVKKSLQRFREVASVVSGDVMPVRDSYRNTVIGVVLASSDVSGDVNRILKVAGIETGSDTWSSRYTRPSTKYETVTFAHAPDPRTLHAQVVDYFEKKDLHPFVEIQPSSFNEYRLAPGLRSYHVRVTFPEEVKGTFTVGFGERYTGILAPSTF